MPVKNKYATLLYSVVIFVLFFSYYYITSSSLPHGAGPDWRSNTTATQFIYEHGRLAVLPDDEKDLHFTVSGGTRALRPPLSYIVSAATASILSFTELDSHVIFRKGSALLCALAVALAFYALSIYFGSYGSGIIGATIIGLMPQFTFIASYNNDDSGAIFSATLVVAVLVRIYRYGTNSTNAALIGLACGLVILSKLTAWLLFPTILLFLAYFVRTTVRSLLRYTAIAGLFFMLSGGWWLAMNMYNYGIDDPILLKISSTVGEQHRRLPPEAFGGYISQGIGYYDLLIKNHNNFLGETAKSTIGNLDWLKLRVGPLQYSFYLAIFYIAIFYYLFSLVRAIVRNIRGRPGGDAETKQLAFESLLFMMFCFQMFMYTWTNINNDIQIQGKYIIPVFLPVLLLFFSGIYYLPRLSSMLTGNKAEKYSPETASHITNPRVILVALIIVFYIHWDAWVNYVIPFYSPPAYNIKLGEFYIVPLNKELHQQTDSLDIQITDSGIQYLSTGIDPKIIFKNEICRKLTTTSLLYLEFYANNADTLQIFIDENNGFSAKTSFSAGYKRGDNIVLLPVSAEHCQRLRLDPFIESGSILMKSFKIAPMSILKKPQ